MSDDLWQLIVAVLGGAAGVGGILLAAMESRLRKVFTERSELYDGSGTPRWASRDEVNGMGARVREDLNGIGARVNGLETVAVQARDSADEAASQVEILRTEQRFHIERTAEKMREVMDRMGAIVERLERTSETLIRVEERVNSKAK